VPLAHLQAFSRGAIPEYDPMPMSYSERYIGSGGTARKFHDPISCLQAVQRLQVKRFVAAATCPEDKKSMGYAQPAE